MALQASLNRFNKQQEKSLSTFARAGAPSKDVARAPLSRQFTNDIERLQLISNIRNSPASAQIKRVVDLLLERRQSLTAEEINEACYVDLKTNKTVFDSLRNNPKVRFEGNHFSYKSKHNVNNKAQLLSLLKKKEFREGIAVADLEDAYTTVMDDLQALKASKEIWMISGSDGKETIVFYDELRDLISVDDEIKKLFREVELPRDMIEIDEKDLKKNRMTPATDSAKRRTAAHVYGTDAMSKQKKKKERKLSKRVKLTNAHLPELISQFY